MSVLRLSIKDDLFWVYRRRGTVIGFSLDMERLGDDRSQAGLLE